MGADGGVIWLKVRDLSEFYKLTDWYRDLVFNINCQGLAKTTKELYSEIKDLYTSDDSIVFAGYGTDCAYDLDTLRILVRWLTSADDDYAENDMLDIRDYTFNDLILDLQTNNYFDLEDFNRYKITSLNISGANVPYEMCLFIEVIANHLCGFATIPELYLNMTLREYGKRLSDASEFHVLSEETWT